MSSEKDGAEEFILAVVKPLPAFFKSFSFLLDAEDSSASTSTHFAAKRSFVRTHRFFRSAVLCVVCKVVDIIFTNHFIAFSGILHIRILHLPSTSVVASTVFSISPVVSDIEGVPAFFISVSAAMKV